MFMANFHICYCGLLRLPHVKHTVSGEQIGLNLCIVSIEPTELTKVVLFSSTSWSADGLPVIYSILCMLNVCS